MPNNVQNIPQTRQRLTIEDFSQVNLIHKETGLVHKIAPNRLLVVKDVILNPNGNIKIKGEGLQLTQPFQESYIVDLTEYSVSLRSNENGGKYSQDVGIGNDAMLSLAISFKVDGTAQAITNLVKQQSAYKGAIRRTSEAIMRLLILKHFDLSKSSTLSTTSPADGEHTDIDLTKYYDNKKIILDILGLWENVVNNYATASDYDKEIQKEAEQLYNTYGIVLHNITIVDMDLPPEIKATIEKNKTAASERERAKKQSELEKTIAENQAAADYERRIKKYEAYKAAGLTEEQIAEIIKMQNIPMDANVFLNSDKTTEGFAKGFAATGSKGKSK